MSYEDDIVIDEQALDIEWLNQSRLMHRYCEVSADAQRRLGIAKERLDFVAAQLNQAIRSDPAAHGVVAGARGVTEDAIKSAIQVHPDYQAAVTDHLDAKYEADVAVGAVRAFDQRKSALENLVRLMGQSYFAGPSIARDLHDERVKRDAAAQRNVRIRRRADA